MTSYVDNTYHKDILSKYTKLANEVIDLICEYSKETQNDICKRIFWDSLSFYKEGSIKIYRPMYYKFGKYFNIEIEIIFIKAHSNEKACLLWMDYMAENLKIKKVNIKEEYYFKRYNFMCDIYYDGWSGTVTDNSILKLKEYPIKRNFPKEMLDSYYKNMFDNDTLWLVECETPIVIS